MYDSATRPDCRRNKVGPRLLILPSISSSSPRSSQVDVVQSVGRVMRQAPGKRLGYIILPVVIPAGSSPEAALRDPVEAVRLAERATPGIDHPIVLDTLAAAYASEGRFDEAAATARRAADRARAIPELRSRAAAIDQRLRLYLARQPYRMPE